MNKFSNEVEIKDISKEDLFKKIEVALAEELIKSKQIYDSALSYNIKNIDKNIEYKLEKIPEIKDYGITNNDIINDEIERQKKYDSNRNLAKIIVIIISLYSFLHLKSHNINEGSLILSILLGLFSLTISPMFLKEHESKIQDAFKNYIKDCIAHSNWQQKLKKDFWLNLSGREFEFELAKLYRSKGYNAIVTKSSGDGGVDIVLEKDDEKILVQCKAHKKAVGPSTIRDLYGAMNSFKVNKGILASLNGFTSGVYKFAKGKNIQLITIDNILEMTK